MELTEPTACVMTPSERALILFGTGEPVDPPRELVAGPLAVQLDRGNLRYLRWHGLEVVRGIAFVLRDASWGTHSPAISDLVAAESADAFEVTYEARRDGPEGDFAYSVRITGDATGTLAFRANGASSRSFLTCRTGFVVLHPLEGVVGRDVEVQHCSGATYRAKFPDLISPDQPIFDIRQLTHRPRREWTVCVHMEGDAFEMEDHRNWTDASFKTYVRPLSRGYPYTIRAGETVQQAVTVAVSGPAPPEEGIPEHAVVRIGGSLGRVPRLGLFVEPQDVATAAIHAQQLKALRPAYLVGRVDLRLRDAGAQLAALDGLARSIGSPLSLQLVIDGIAPRRELDLFAAGIRRIAMLDSVHVVPARDLKSRQGNHVPAGEANPEDMLAAACQAFPGTPIGGGMTVPFAELNRNRPPAGIDFLAHATQANVHAADDVSVMETIEALPHVIRSARSFAGAVPYRLGPSTIGTSRFTVPGHVAPNPRCGRVTMAADDPRQQALFGAAFALGLTAVAAAGRVDGLTFASVAGPAGILFPDGRLTPAAVFFQSFASLADAQYLQTGVEHSADISAVAVQSNRGAHLFLANRSPKRRSVIFPGFLHEAVSLIDAQTLFAGESGWTAHITAVDDVIDLDAYAVAMLDVRQN